MSMAWIRGRYGVPAKRGGRVLYTGCGRVAYGTIKSAKGGRLVILLDGDKHSAPFHPTWELSYIAGFPKTTTPQPEGQGMEQDDET